MTHKRTQTSKAPISCLFFQIYKANESSIHIHPCGFLSTHSFSVTNLPDPRPLIFPIDPTLDKPLKLLLPSLKLWDHLDFLCLGEELSSQSTVLILATTRWLMLLRQNGQTGADWAAVVGLGLLWQQRARVQWAHIWCPQSWTSIVHTWSKQMQHSSVSLA